MTVSNLKIFPDRDTGPEHELRYSVYSYEASTTDGIAYTRSFIVLKNGYDVIVRFTRLQDFAGVYATRTFIPISADPAAKLHYISAMLNYTLVYHGKENGIRHIFDITKQMLEAFFTDYALQKKTDDSYRGRETVERCIGAVTRFMANLVRKYSGYMKLESSNLYREEPYYTSRGQQLMKKVPDFQIRGIQEVQITFRDLPTKAFELLLPLAFRYAPDIAFAMCLQAFAGLRAGEALNVRQEESPIGSGLRFTEIAGRVAKVEIDLKKVYVLRSDRTKVGRIKKPRTQCVYPPYLEAFCTAYGYHKRYLSDHKFEEAYAPMFPNSLGMAMTYDSYRKKFESLVDKRLRPLLLESADPELRIYGQLLCENALTSHSLRHWFTVQLVLRGEDIAGIQFWRGDRTPQSAFEYLQNKGDLNRELREADGRLAELLMKAGELFHE